MKLIKAYVSSFGKLKDFEYDFNDGVNVLNYDNGWGKSTFATFIKCMFYGLKDRSRSIEDNERIKYKPWNSTELFGGYIEFSWGESKYKLERYFGNKQSEDIIRLFDVETGREFKNTENLGDRIFKIDEDGFSATTYFSELDIEAKPNTSLTAKFNGINSEGGTDEYNKAVEKLEKKYKNFSYSGQRGLIPDIKREIIETETAKKSADRAYENAKIIKKEVESLETEVDELETKMGKLAKEVEKAGMADAIRIKQNNFRELNEERDNLYGEYTKKKSFIDKIGVTDDRLNSLSVCINEYGKNVERLNILKSDMEKIDNVGNGNTGRTNPLIICAVVSAILLVFGIVGIILNTVLGIVLFSLFALSVIGGVFIVYNSKNKGKNNADSFIFDKRKEYEEAKEVCNKYKTALDEFFVPIDIKSGYGEKLDYLKETYSTVKNLEKRIAELDLKIKPLKADSDLYADVAVVDSERVRSEFINTKNLFAEKSGALSIKKSSYDNLMGQADSSEYDNKLEELNNKLSEYNEEYKIIKTTLDFMKEADENLRRKYRAPLTEKLNEYLKYIAGEINANIDLDLKISIEEKGFSRDTKYYSKGYKNLYEICKRFALISVLFTDEKPFIILDDPFVNLDNEKLCQALSLIKKLGNDYQILYFVCHDSRVVKD